MRKLVRYWYSPQGIITRNIGGWRLGHLTKVGRKFYTIRPLSAEDVRVKYEIAYTHIKEV